jgi:hypothetical protein
MREKEDQRWSMIEKDAEEYEIMIKKYASARLEKRRKETPTTIVFAYADDTESEDCNTDEDEVEYADDWSIDTDYNIEYISPENKLSYLLQEKRIYENRLEKIKKQITSLQPTKHF